MRVVGLVSGGKDSVHALVLALGLLERPRDAAGCAELCCLANLTQQRKEEQEPQGAEGGGAGDWGDEGDGSFMFQFAGEEVVEAMAVCVGVPLVRRHTRGRSVNQQLVYAANGADAGAHGDADEVEDLFALLWDVKRQFPDVEGVVSGAILSTYQRSRVESVCTRLGLQSLSPLWQATQRDLIAQMVDDAQMEAVLVKVAAAGLEPDRYLGKTINARMLTVFDKLHQRFGFHVCGEGGEYETFVLDSPLYKRWRIVLDETEVRLNSEDPSVGVLHVHHYHTEAKSQEVGEEVDDAPVILWSTESPPSVATPESAVAVAASETTASSGTTGTTHVAVKESSPGCLASSLSSHIAAAPPASDPEPEPSPSPTAEALADRAARQTALALTAVSDALAGYHASILDVVFVHLYLRDMAHFQAVNNAYCGFFQAHPPSRSCVQSAFWPADEGDTDNDMEQELVRLDVLALTNSHALMVQGQRHHRRVLHVQSRSFWAPLCIGPYSQANTLCDGWIMAAGQIPLDPWTMQLPRQERTLSLADELDIALRNAAQVLACEGAVLHDCVSLVIYTADAEGGQSDTGLALVAAARECLLHNAGVPMPQPADAPANAEAEEDWNSEASELELEEKRQTQEALRARLACVPIFCIPVPVLPKGARVEVEVVGTTAPLDSIPTVQEEWKSVSRATGGSCRAPLPPLWPASLIPGAVPGQARAERPESFATAAEQQGHDHHYIDTETATVGKRRCCGCARILVCEPADVAAAAETVAVDTRVESVLREARSQLSERVLPALQLDLQALLHMRLFVRGPPRWMREEHVMRAWRTVWGDTPVTVVPVQESMNAATAAAAAVTESNQAVRIEAQALLFDAGRIATEKWIRRPL